MFGLTPYTRRNNTPAYYDPFRDLENFEKNFFGSGELPTFKTDIRDTGDAYELEADLPGFQKKNIKIDIEGEQLTIRAERKGDREEKDKKGNYVYRERSFGTYSRSFDISGVRTQDISAKYNDGVLTLTLPKLQETKPETRRLEIG